MKTKTIQTLSFNELPEDIQNEMAQEYIDSTHWDSDPMDDDYVDELIKDTGLYINKKYINVHGCSQGYTVRYNATDEYLFDIGEEGREKLDELMTQIEQIYVAHDDYAYSTDNINATKEMLAEYETEYLLQGNKAIAL